ncbi:hypothetical protein RE9425_03420 [Prescottella equi]|nr:hypothetical protein RE9425_03420 [Prescottella equi]
MAWRDDDEARRQRELAARRAIHSTRLDGGVVSLELLADLADLVEGRAAVDELIRRTLDQCDQRQERAVVLGLDELVDQFIEGTLTLEEVVQQALDRCE